MKSGTSTLARQIGEHPDGFMVDGKEVYFFDRDAVWERGLAWYRSLFAPAEDAAAVGEASPSTMFTDVAVSRAAAVVPDARILVILRNPVDRLYSHYWHERFFQRETRPFDAVVASELGADDPATTQLVGRSMYRRQLERLRRHFPHDRIRVFLLDDLEADPAATFTAACTFLGIDPAVRVPSLGTVVNPAKVSRSAWILREMTRYRLWRLMPVSTARRLQRMLVKEQPYEPLDAAMRARLVTAFRDDVDWVADLLGRDLSAWTDERANRASMFDAASR
jgi:hypothetical protein